MAAGAGDVGGIISIVRVERPVRLKREAAIRLVELHRGDADVQHDPAGRLADEPVELAGETIQGATWDSADERGEVVVVNLWASWCGPCAKEAPHLVEAHEETKGEDVAFVGINYRESSKETGRAQGEEWGFVWPSVYDKSGQSAIDMQGKMTTQPSTAVLDREGRIAAVVLGPVTTSTLVGVVEDTLAESA